MNTPAEAITGIQKAAILLITLGPVDSAKILQHIPEDEANQLAKAIVQLDRVPAARVQSTLEEFGQLTASHHLFVKGGIEYAEKDADRGVRPCDRARARAQTPKIDE